MRIRILEPARIVFDEEALRISADGVSGSFGILPGHIDFVEPLDKGILSIVRKDESELFLAVNEGLLIKQGDDVMICTPEAVMSEYLSRLLDTVDREFLKLSDRERQTRSAMARLESDFIRRFIEE